MAGNNMLEKGLYHHPQPSGCMSVKQYIIIERNKKKCLILRFFNESSLNISDMEFRVTQHDSVGDVIDSVTVSVSDMKVSPGGTYSLKKGIVISRSCADFRISVLWVLSKGYKYVIKNGQMVPHFDTRGYSASKDDGVRRGSVTVKRRGVPGARIVAAISVLLIMATVGLSLYLSLRLFGNFDTSDSRNSSYSDLLQTTATALE